MYPVNIHNNAFANNAEILSLSSSLFSGFFGSLLPFGGSWHNFGEVWKCLALIHCGNWFKFFKPDLWRRQHTAAYSLLIVRRTWNYLRSVLKTIIYYCYTFGCDIFNTLHFERDLFKRNLFIARVFLFKAILLIILNIISFNIYLQTFFIFDKQLNLKL